MRYILTYDRIIISALTYLISSSILKNTLIKSIIIPVIVTTEPPTENTNSTTSKLWNSVMNGCLRSIGMYAIFLICQVVIIKIYIKH